MKYYFLCSFLVSVLSGGLFLFNCSTSSGSSSSSEAKSYEQLATMTVDPSDWLGDVVCSEEEGAIHSYVVTLTDVTDENNSIVLASSPPISCTQQVHFQYTISEHLYTAVIHGYDYFADEILPVGGQSSGSNHMVLVSDGTSVNSRWTTNCGIEPNSPTEVILYENTHLNGCEELLDSNPLVNSSIRIELGLVFKEFSCLSTGGTIESYDIFPLDSDLAEILSNSCSADSIIFEDGVENEKSYSFYIKAYTQGATTPTYGTTCYATTQIGLESTAQCNLLSSQGAIQIAAEDLIQSTGIHCSDPNYKINAKCGEDIFFSQLDPKTFTISVSLLDESDRTLEMWTCESEVLPGKISKTDCTLVEPV